jgi:hypothetical protein
MIVPVIVAFRFISERTVLGLTYNRLNSYLLSTCGHLQVLKRKSGMNISYFKMWVIKETLSCE